MKTLILEKQNKIIRNRKKLEKALDVKISNRRREIFINGSPENEYTAEKVIDALRMEFPLSIALLIKKEDYDFEILKIKDYTNRKNLCQVRARIIGKKGKTLKTLSELTNCHFEIKDNYIGIIGPPENIKIVQEGLISLIRGSKQSNVYHFLEKNHFKGEDDLGLKG